MSVHIQRLEKELLRFISSIINNDLRDKNIEWVTVTSISLSKDLSFLKVYYSHLNKSSDGKVQKALTKSAGYIKREIANKKMMRKIPEIIFYYDTIEENARNLDKIFEQIEAEK
jgi:ribosome-binding factor A